MISMVNSLYIDCGHFLSFSLFLSLSVSIAIARFFTSNSILLHKFMVSTCVLVVRGMMTMEFYLEAHKTDRKITLLICWCVCVRALVYLYVWQQLLTKLQMALTAVVDFVWTKSKWKKDPFKIRKTNMIGLCLATVEREWDSSGRFPVYATCVCVCDVCLFIVKHAQKTIYFICFGFRVHRHLKINNYQRWLVRV